MVYLRWIDQHCAVVGWVAEEMKRWDVFAYIDGHVGGHENGDIWRVAHIGTEWNLG